MTKPRIRAKARSEPVVLPFRVVRGGKSAPDPEVLEWYDAFRQSMVAGNCVAVAMVAIMADGKTHRSYHPGGTHAMDLAGAVGWLAHGLHEA